MYSAARRWFRGRRYWWHTLNVFGGGGNAHGSHHSYGNHAGGASYYGGSQPSSHNQGNYSHRHEGHSAWGAGGNGSQHGNRGASGRQGVVVVHEYYGKPVTADTSYGTSSGNPATSAEEIKIRNPNACLLYTSDAADED